MENVVKTNESLHINFAIPSPFNFDFTAFQLKQDFAESAMVFLNFCQNYV